MKMAQESHTPEFISVGREWQPNYEKQQFEGEPLFTTNGRNVKIFHGDSFWTFPDDRRIQGYFMIANQKWDYNDRKPRFKTKQEIQEAIKVYEWLHGSPTLIKSTMAQSNQHKIKFTGEGVEEEFKDRVCFQGCINDYTLCGITLDGDTDTAGDYASTDEKVNCTDCINIVKYCKKLTL